MKPEDLFVHQIHLLRARGCPEIILRYLMKQQKDVMEKTREVGGLFLPVISLVHRGLYDLMAMLRIDRAVGFTNLKPSDLLSDILESPDDPYYVFGVDDGSSLMQMSPDETIDFFVKRDEAKRFLRTAEIIALGLHANILLSYNIWAAGSRSRNGMVPALVTTLGKPELISYFADHKVPWGLSFCFKEGGV